MEIVLGRQEGHINDMLAGRQVYMPVETTRVAGNDLKQGYYGL